MGEVSPSFLSVTVRTIGYGAFAGRWVVQVGWNLATGIALPTATTQAVLALKIDAMGRREASPMVAGSKCQPVV